MLATNTVPILAKIVLLRFGVCAVTRFSAPSENPTERIIFSLSHERNERNLLTVNKCSVTLKNNLKSKEMRQKVGGQQKCNRKVTEMATRKEKEIHIDI